MFLCDMKHVCKMKADEHMVISQVYADTSPLIIWRASFCFW